MTDSPVARIVRDASLERIASESVEWSLAQLTGALSAAGIEVRDDAGTDAAVTIRIAALDGVAAELLTPEEAREFATRPEAYAIHADRDGALTLTVAGADSRGLGYALLELDDIVRHADDALAALSAVESSHEAPANSVRGIMRLFTSEPEDKPWFYSKEFWDEYLTELARQRFNRFTFSVGAGYDYLIDRAVDDTYFCFFYPFVLDVPGYSVGVAGLSEEERSKNLEMIRYIGEQTRLRGMTFRLGLWDHAYDYGPDNVGKAWAIEGLDAENHAAYCRDALVALLEAVPEVEGLTFRVHFEGGVPEPTHEFWATVLERLGEVDTLIDLDFHAKGVNDELVETTQSLGKDFTLSAKYWAEHMGPPYHQSSIRDREFGRRKARTSPAREAFFGAPSTGHHDPTVGGTGTTSKRSFTRYGYGDFLRDDRPYELFFRVWPGTQRILSWGDPAMAAGIGRQAGFGGSLGVEWFEPLSFKGKKGSGSVGGRELYSDESLKLGIDDWKKFRYSYRLLGRLSYNPDASPDVWRRFLTSSFGPAAAAVEAALGSATRILPFVLLTHAPSVANNVYWPEMYTNVPLVRGSDPLPNRYGPQGWPVNSDFDMDAPYNAMTVSSLDPELFSSAFDFADSVLVGTKQARYSPLDAADRLQAMAGSALAGLRDAERLIPDAGSADFRRLAVDVAIMAHLGAFFAEKFRASVAYALFERTGSKSFAGDALEYYRRARNEWAAVVAVSVDVYRDDITFGQTDYSRGHWADRMPAIDADIAAVEAQYEAAVEDGEGRTLATMTALRAVAPSFTHEVQAGGFAKGHEVPVSIEFAGAAEVTSVVLHYRHTDQSADYHTVDADAAQSAGAQRFEAVIPAGYTDSAYDLEYFFEVTGPRGDAWLLPGLADDISNQPYFVVPLRKA